MDSNYYENDEDYAEQHEQRVQLNQSGRQSQYSQQSNKRSIRPTPKRNQQQYQQQQQQQLNENQENNQQQQQQNQFQYSEKNSQYSVPPSRHSTLNELLEKQAEMKNDTNEGRIDEYEEDEEEFICARFPHLDFCACPEQCTISVVESKIYELFNGVFIADFVGGNSIKKMMQAGITHVLNVTAMEYKKRTKYFKYLDIDVYDNSDEDIKKHFRITNRFISEALQNNGKVLIHDRNGKNIAPSFALAYLINNEKLPLKNGLEVISQQKQDIEIKPNFWKQLERYDLEKLALVTLKKKK